MIERDCVREQELVDAMTKDRWPDIAAPDLRRHVEICTSCREVVHLAEAFHADYAAALNDARLPTASYIWWRAQVRARLEAAQDAERPITVVQGVAAAAVVALAISAGAISWLMTRGGTIWEQLTRLYGSDGWDVFSSLLNAPPLALAAAVACLCVVVLTPIVFFVTLSEE